MVDLSESDSEQDEIMEYINRSDSSDTDSEDNLMVSQELRPGFSTLGAKDQHPQSLNSVPEVEEITHEQVQGFGPGHANIHSQSQGDGFKGNLGGLSLSNSLNR